jgi:putative transposase
VIGWHAEPVADLSGVPDGVGAKAQHLLAVLGEYLAHYNRQTASGPWATPPPGRDTLPAPVTDLTAVRVRRRKVLHGLINEYEQAA